MTVTTTKQQTWTVLSILDWTANFLKSKGIKEARLDTEVLLSYTLGLKRLDLYLQFERQLTQEERDRFRELVKKRSERIPIAYILGEKEFMGLKFKVNPNVLIPRPETELVVEEVNSLLKEISIEDKAIIVDVCTGSGNIPISIAKYNDNVDVYAIDINDETVGCAQKNAIDNGVHDRTHFLKGDLLNPLVMYPFEGKVDIITSNPPYIKSADMKTLQPEVLREPKNALDGGPAGDIYYKKIIDDSIKYLKQGGYIIFEISPDLTDIIIKQLNSQNFTDIKIKKDYNNLDRIIAARKE